MGVSDSSQLELSFDRFDDVKRFYADIIDRLENTRNRDDETLCSLIAKSIPDNEDGLRIFHDAYLSHETMTMGIIERLLPDLLELWRFDAFEYSKIFYYDRPSKSESDILNSLARIITGKKISPRSPDVKLPEELQFLQDNYLIRPKDVHTMNCSDIRLPHILGQLSEDGYIDKDDIKPSLPQKVYAPEDYIISDHIYRHLDLYTAFTLTPEILSRIDSKFVQTENPAGPFGLIKSREVDPFNGYTAMDLVRIVKEHSSRVFSPEVPLSGYSIVLRTSPEGFVNSHVTDLMLMLNIQFPKRSKAFSSQDLLDTRGEKFISADALGNIDVDMTLHERYAILSFNRIFRSGYESDDGFKVYGIKLLLENYCRKNGISFYSEVNIADSDKLFYIEKYKSAQYAKENMERIRSQLDDDAMLKIVDFCNQHYAFDVDVKNLYECSCDGICFDGTFRYDRNGYIFRNEDDPKLDNIAVDFRLSDLHILARHPEMFNPGVYELESIDQLLRLTKDWKVVVPGPEIEEDYTRIMTLAHDVDEAARSEMEWYDASHGGINATEEEMAKDPDLRKAVEYDNAMMNQVRDVTAIMKDSIDRVYDNLKSKGRSGGNIEKGIADMLSGKDPYEPHLLNLKFNLIRKTYETLKMQHALHPAEYTARIINAVNIKTQELEFNNFMKALERKYGQDDYPPE